MSGNSTCTLLSFSKPAVRSFWQAFDSFSQSSKARTSISSGRLPSTVRFSIKVLSSWMSNSWNSSSWMEASTTCTAGDGTTPPSKPGYPRAMRSACQVASSCQHMSICVPSETLLYYSEMPRRWTSMAGQILSWFEPDQMFARRDMTCSRCA